MNNSILQIDDILALPNVSLLMKWQLPEIQGIYFVVVLPETILYIGQSKNLLNRFKNHNKIRSFNRHLDYMDIEGHSPRIFYLNYDHLSTNEVIELESEYIFKYSPKYNTVGTSKNLIQNYSQRFFRLLNTLNTFYEKSQIIKYINSNAYDSEKGYSSSSVIKNKIQLLNYETSKIQSVIKYKFDFQINSDIDSSHFEEIFIEVATNRHFVKEISVGEEKEELLFELIVSICTN